ncbi:MAG: hypothetical protein CM15mP77_1390 [Synechococcus sp.]|nr:MAG: hypothetical protein CM15mP77_1390 [Synechococcus sp.]
MDVQVSRVRKLVEPDPTRPRYIQTVWGYGYVFVPDGTPRSPEMTRLVFLEAAGASDQRLELPAARQLVVVSDADAAAVRTGADSTSDLATGQDLALNIRLTELTLEHYPPALIKEFTGWIW